MNEIVEQVQLEYREKRELSNYSIFDIESSLKYLAEKGLIWVIRDMNDLCDAERFIIQQYLSEYRTNQIYDNLDDFHLPSIQAPLQHPANLFHQKKLLNQTLQSEQTKYQTKQKSIKE